MALSLRLSLILTRQSKKKKKKQLIVTALFLREFDVVDDTVDARKEAVLLVSVYNNKIFVNVA